MGLGGKSWFLFLMPQELGYAIKAWQYEGARPKVLTSLSEQIMPHVTQISLHVMLGCLLLMVPSINPLLPGYLVCFLVGPWRSQIHSRLR
jgi:hypothetical protein